MDYSKKPTVFFIGEKRKDAPPEPRMTNEQMKRCIRDTDKYVRKEKGKKD